MPLLGFKKEFAEAVRSGEKRQTIRIPRKHPIKPGDRLYLYTGLRTKKCRKLGEGICNYVHHIQILSAGKIIIDGVALSLSMTYEVVRRDGFASVGTFLSWFDKTHGLPFRGQIIEWERVKSQRKRRKK